MSKIFLVQVSGTTLSLDNQVIMLAQGAAFDLSGDIALNTAHREIIAGNPHGTSAIDYKNPIVLTGSITPNSGDFFTTDSKLLTITGSGGEKFWPNGGLTSRIIWGASSGAALPVEINPSSLGIGGVFEIAIDDGESRKIRYDGTDFVKVSGVVIPAYAKISDNATSTNLPVTENIDTPFPMVTIVADNTGQMASATGNGSITLFRPGRCAINEQLRWQLAAANEHTTANRVYKNAAFLGDTGSLSTPTLRVFTQMVGTFDLIANDKMEAYARHSDTTGSETLDIFRDTSGDWNWLEVKEELSGIW